MSISTDTVLKVLQVVVWVIFIGLCIETGALLFNFVYSLFNPVATKNLYLGLNLAELFERHKFIYLSIFSFLLTISALKAFTFYVLIKLFTALNLVKPFSEQIAGRVKTISNIVLVTGLFSVMAHQFYRGLTRKGIPVDHLVEEFWNDSGTLLMMAAILMVISHIFKKGVELQMENDLTV